MTFSLDIHYIILSLLGVALVLSLVWVVWYNRRSMRLLKFMKYEERTRRYLAPDDLPAVSILVFANDDEKWLNKFLPTIMRQKYPAPYEVIVVDDASVDGTKDLVGDMMVYFDNLDVTTVPDNTRNISRKKLGVMQGIKKAKNEPGVDVVLGYSHFDYSNDRGPGKNFRVFDEMMTSMQWLVSAINGRVYRGTSDNLAYRKEAFFANKGFSQSQDKKWGDDDIFVSEISNGRNTRLELLPPSFATAHFDDVPHAHSILKSRRDFTSRHVKYKSQFRTQALMSVLYYLRLAALATSIAMAYTNLAVVAAAAFIFLLTWLPTMLTTFRNCYLLRLPLLFFSTPLFIVWRPIVNVAYWIKGLFTYKNNYTSLLN